MIRRHHNTILSGQQRLRIQCIPDITAHPVHTGRHDPVIRTHLPAATA
jgi:hypothetical protein